MEYTVKELHEWNALIEAIADESGLDYYEQEFEIIGYKEMLAYEAYLGMPTRYPHWSFGKAYEKNSTIYRYNLVGLPYEMVINSDPCIAYLMKENTLLLQILTMAHVYGHNDFFKNNRLFAVGTKADYALEMFKSHAGIVRSYINDPSIGYEQVERILNAAHAIKLQITKVVDEKRLSDSEKKQRLIKDYTLETEKHNILENKEKQELPDINRIPLEPEDDLLYFLIKYSELEEWERNLLSIVREESLYFLPQIETKIMNEGWASYWHYNILKKLSLPDALYLEFIKHHNDVIATGLGYVNPYFIGYKIFEDIRNRYGNEKLFEARLLERDESFLRKYLTEELCKELNLFEYVKNGTDYIVKEVADSEGWTIIRNVLCSDCGMNSVPLIRANEVLKKDKSLLLEHVFDGRELNMNYAEATLKYVYELWGHKVSLKSKLNRKDITLVCEEKNKVVIK